MNWHRKGMMLMLAVVVFWTALPVSTCLLAGRQTVQPDCCRAMARACNSPVMGANGACCQIHGSNPAQVPVQPNSPVQSLETVALPGLGGTEVPAVSGSGYMNAFEAPPPKFPPGGAFALRI
jgi:hypothetical protein